MKTLRPATNRLLTTLALLGGVVLFAGEAKADATANRQVFCEDIGFDVYYGHSVGGFCRTADATQYCALDADRAQGNPVCPAVDNQFFCEEIGFDIYYGDSVGGFCRADDFTAFCALDATRAQGNPVCEAPTSCDTIVEPPASAYVAGNGGWGATSSQFNSRYSYFAGIKNTEVNGEDEIWVGAIAGATAKMWIWTVSLVEMEVSAKNTNGVTTGRTYFSRLGTTMVDMVGIGAEFEQSVVFVEKNVSFYPLGILVTVTGSLGGSLGVEGSADLSDGLNVNVTPFARVSASLSGGVGIGVTGIAEATVNLVGSLTMLGLDLPVTGHADYDSSNGVFSWDANSRMLLTGLSGDLQLVFKAILLIFEETESIEIFSWDGQTYGDIQLMEASGCF
jgi:hypothetical protein